MSLPENWTRTSLDKEVTTIRHPEGGVVTIIWRDRGFALGYTNFVGNRRSGFAKYCGRSWRERLEADAIAALTEIYKDEK